MIMTTEQKDEFRKLACALSPENLFCDGEISYAQGIKRMKKINKRWKELEAAVGFSVSQDEVWSWVTSDLFSRN